jgi:hypothetical protein
MNNLNKSVKKDELEIDLPPNFNLYAEEEKNDEEIIFEDYQKLGESNPLTIPPKKTQAIDFSTKKMERYDLDKMLNPHKNDLDIMGNDLNMYREKVKNQTEEVEKLEMMKKQLQSQSFMGNSVDINQIRREKELLKQHLNTQHIEENNFFDSDRNMNVKVNVQTQYQPQIIQETGDFFDTTEVIVQNNKGYYLNDNFGKKVQSTPFNNNVHYNTTEYYEDSIDYNNHGRGNYYNESVHYENNLPKESLSYVKHNPEYQNVDYQPQRAYSPNVQYQPQRDYSPNIQYQPERNYSPNVRYVKQDNHNLQDQYIQNTPLKYSQQLYVNNQPKTSFVNYEGFNRHPDNTNNSFMTDNLGDYKNQFGDNRSFEKHVFNNYY